MYLRCCREHYRQCDRTSQCIGADVENTTGSVTELVSVLEVTELVSVLEMM